MKPGFLPGDLLLVSRAAYVDVQPARGDVVVVNEPAEGAGRFLKRLVGLPGETVSFDEGLLLIDGERLVEPYLNGLPAVVGLDNSQWTLGSGKYFVLGDNRAQSIDSREFGPVRAEDILGKAWFRYWPASRVGRVN